MAMIISPSALFRHDVGNEVESEPGVLLWFTGLSGSGKSTMALETSRILRQRSFATSLLDGDVMRRGLCSDLGYTEKDRSENIRRASEVSKLLMTDGRVVLASFISPKRIDRENVRRLIAPHKFIEIYCDASIAICEQRDPKGLYAKSRAGKLPNFTGISAPYETPLTPDIRLPTGVQPIDACVALVMEHLHLVGLNRR